MRNESLTPDATPRELEGFIPHTTPATSAHAPGTLVDKYGQVFEGRAGGITKDVVGSHTGGFNRDVWGVSLIAQTGLTFDLATPHGKMIAGVMASLAEFERDLIRERIKSGLEAARARGTRLGRQVGQRPKSDRLAAKVMELVAAGRSYREIALEVRLSKNTIMSIVKRSRESG